MRFLAGCMVTIIAGVELARWWFYSTKSKLPMRRATWLSFQCVWASRSRNVLIAAIAGVAGSIVGLSLGVPSFQGACVLFLCVAVLGELALPPTFLVLGSSATTPFDVLPTVSRSIRLAKTCHLLKSGRARSWWLVNLRNRVESRWGPQLTVSSGLAGLVVIDVRDDTPPRQMSLHRFSEFDRLLHTNDRNTILIGPSTSVAIQKVVKARPPLGWIQERDPFVPALRRFLKAASPLTITELRDMTRGWPS